MLKMSKICKITLNLFLLFLSVLVLSNCVTLKSVDELKKTQPPTDRDILFERAEQLSRTGDYDSAQSIYFKITREPTGPIDPVYDKSLWNLALYYETSDQSEKALLALDELSRRNSSIISRARIQFALVKNHFRVTNYFQAKKIRAEIDNDYKSQHYSRAVLYDALYYTTTLYYDRHILDELVFVGEIQKYFIYIMESDFSPQNETLTELLIFYYEGFFKALNKNLLSKEIKRQLSMSLLDQLRRFERLKIEGNYRNPRTMARFSEYADTQQKKLTEWLTNEND